MTSVILSSWMWPSSKYKSTPLLSWVNILFSNCINVTYTETPKWKQTHHLVWSSELHREMSRWQQISLGVIIRGARKCQDNNHLAWSSDLHVKMTWINLLSICWLEMWRWQSKYLEYVWGDHQSSKLKTISDIGRWNE